MPSKALHDKKAGAAFAGLRANEGLRGARKTIWLNTFLSSCHFLSLTGSIALHLVCEGQCKWLDVVCNMQKTFLSAKRNANFGSLLLMFSPEQVAKNVHDSVLAAKPPGSLQL